jgi:uncharacterized protein YbaP (TraB family)
MLALRRLFLLAWLLIAAPALAIPALWTAAKGGQMLTLYGTIHALPPGGPDGQQGWFTPKARAAFAAADTLVVEMVAPEEPGAMAAVVQDIGFLPAPVPIRDRLPDDLKPRYDAMRKASDLPLANLDRMKSWFAAISLVQLEMLMAGIDPAAGVDVSLIARARAAKKALIGLETPRGQLELFNGLPEAEQRLLLASAISDVGQSKTAMLGLVDTWTAGDVERLRKDFDDSGLSPELDKRLFRDRNAAWADFVARQGGKRRMFMAVGAAHMAGPGSLIEMLQARGYKVRRVE